ncbi:maspardin-like [Argonauta hians]
MGELAKTLEYHSFRSTIPLKKIVVDDDHHKSWSLYDAGPRTVRCPLIFFPPASGTADVFFKQIFALSAVGYRVIAVDYPVYWNLREICEGFQKLLDHLQLDKVHIFGASLGGFIAQKFAEYTSTSPRVASLMLCNSFNDTSIFQQTSAAPTFWMMPALFLRKMVIGSFQKGMVDSSIADSIDFLVDKLDNLPQKVLASRLTLNCMSSYIEPQKLIPVDITIMDVFDNCALSQAVKDEMYKCYPNAKRAHLKSGGNFPYLSRSTEVNVFIKVHLQKYEGTKSSAKEDGETSDVIPLEKTENTAETIDILNEDLNGDKPSNNREECSLPLPL